MGLCEGIPVSWREGGEGSRKRGEKTDSRRWWFYFDRIGLLDHGEAVCATHFWPVTSHASRGMIMANGFFWLVAATRC